MPQPAPAGTLGQKLCEIEQSQGVCHVAQVQLWPSASRRQKSSQPRPTIRGILDGTGTVFSPNRPPDSEILVGRDGAGGSPVPLNLESRQVSSVHQPNPSRLQKMPLPRRHLMRTSAGKVVNSSKSAQKVSNTDKDYFFSGHATQPSGDRTDIFDEDLQRSVDTAIDRIVDATRVSCSNGDVVSLGPAVDVPPTRMLLCGRIPEQLAELRTKTRELSATCENLASSVVRPPACESDNADTAFRELKAAHDAAMTRAQRLLGIRTHASPRNDDTNGVT